MNAQDINSKKSSTATKWLIGCGIGCGVVILIAAILGVGGYFFVKNIVDGFEETEAIADDLKERYGEIKDFTPDPECSIRPERLEAFLSVRSSMEQVKESLENSFRILSDEERESQFEEEPSAGVMTKIKTGFGIIPLIAEFLTSRNQGLLDAKMGLGEYYYIYIVSYYSWLGKSPRDGLEFNLRDDDGRDRGVYWSRGRDEDLEDQLDNLLKQLNRHTLPMLQNQFAELTGVDVSPIKDPWRVALAAEIEAMEKDRFRLPWQDGLPDALEASLRPYRGRLEVSYNKTLNALEMTLD